MKIDYAVKNNFGFGGTNGTLVFSLTVPLGRYRSIRGGSGGIGIPVRGGLRRTVQRGVAALTVTAALATAAWGGERRRPVAFEIGQDGLTTWDRAGNAQYRRITGCAQWSDRLLALTCCRREAARHRFWWLPTRSPIPEPSANWPCAPGAAPRNICNACNRRSASGVFRQS
jgi:hypothetical protein